MKIIIKKTQEIKEVSFGYAVNYLIPQGLAVLATEKAMAQIKQEEKKREKKKAQKENKDEKRALRFKGKEFVIKKKAGKTGKLYSAVSKKQIAETMGVEKKEVILKEPIKKTGEYKIDLKIGAEKIKVKVKVKKE